MKKIQLSIIALIIMMGVIGCVSLSDGEKYKVFTNKEIESVTQETLDIFEMALRDKDADAITDLFSDFTKSKYNIRNEVEMFLNFIEGDVLEIKKSYIGINRSTYYHDKGEVKLFYNGKVKGVKTSEEKTYNILIEGTFYYKDCEDKIGINYLYVYDESVETDNEGNRPGGEFEVGDVIK